MYTKSKVGVFPTLEVAGSWTWRPHVDVTVRSRESEVNSNWNTKTQRVGLPCPGIRDMIFDHKLEKGLEDLVAGKDSVCPKQQSAPVHRTK